MIPTSKQLSLAHKKSANYSRVYPRFFLRVDRVLRRSLGVSETAKTEVNVKPAPEVDPTEPEEEVPEVPQHFGNDLFDESFMNPMILDKDTGEKIRDEL